MIAKAPGDGRQQAATLRTLYGYQWTHPGKKLLFMGQASASGTSGTRTLEHDRHPLDHPFHQRLLRYVNDLNHLDPPDRLLGSGR